MSARASVSSAVRFTPEVHQRLVAEADARGVSMNWLVNRLCAEAMEHLIPVGEQQLTRWAP